MTPEVPVVGSALRPVGMDALRKRWGWCLAVGVLLVVLGLIAIGSAAVATLATMLVIGWLLAAGGVAMVAHAFAVKGWSGFFIDLVGGLLYAAVGLLVVANPVESAVTLTLVIAALLVVGGVFRIGLFFSARYPHSPWLLLNGVVNLLLGLVIWSQWPLDGLWVIGTVVGIDLIFNGWALVMLGLAARSHPAGDL